MGAMYMYADDQGRVIELSPPEDPSARLDPVVVDGVTYQRVTHDPVRWRWYDADKAIEGEEAEDVAGLTPRCIYRECGDHPDVLMLSLTPTNLVKGRFTLRKPTLAAGDQVYGYVERDMVPRGPGGAPISSSAPSKRVDLATCTEIGSMGKHRLFRHKDGTTTIEDGRVVLQSNSAVKDLCRRTGLESVDPRSKEARAGYGEE